MGGVFYSVFDEVRLGLTSFQLSNLPEVPPLEGPSVKVDANGVVEFQFNAAAAAQIIPQYSEDLATWIDLPAVTAQPGPNIIRDETSASRPTAFYRLKGG